jgi:heptaprenyl diphosphate synthase
MGKRVMKFIDWNHQANIIQDYLDEQLHHSFLQEYIKEPTVDRDRIYFLLLPFSEADMSSKPEIVQWISTAMLLQVALDTHEKVTVSDEESLLERQLTVLAGVYFSSLYYKILAKADNIGLIRKLARAITDINESKISIYKKEESDMESLLENIRIMESSIISHFLSFFHQESWSPLIEEVLLFKKLVGEKQSFANRDTTPFIESVVKIHFSKTMKSESPLILSQEQDTMMSSILDALLIQSKNEILYQLEQVKSESPFIYSQILKLVEQSYTMPQMKLYAEEG